MLPGVTWARHLFLPTLTFTIVFIGQYMLIMRSTLLEVLSEDYILTAKAKGLTTFQILSDHALRNATLPIVTVIALNLGFYRGGRDSDRDGVLVAGARTHRFRGGGAA